MAKPMQCDHNATINFWNGPSSTSSRLFPSPAQKGAPRHNELFSDIYVDLRFEERGRDTVNSALAPL